MCGAPEQPSSLAVIKPRYAELLWFLVLQWFARRPLCARVLPAASSGSGQLEAEAVAVAARHAWSIQPGKVRVLASGFAGCDGFGWKLRSWSADRVEVLLQFLFELEQARCFAGTAVVERRSSERERRVAHFFVLVFCVGVDESARIHALSVEGFWLSTIFSVTSKLCRLQNR